MKKFLALILASLFVLACFGCAKDEPKVMTYAEYEAAAIDAPVVVETYVQAMQGWWDNKAIVYTQTPEGAYFIYDMPCTEDEYNKMVKGTKIRVEGVKGEYKGEIEILDVTKVEILEGSWIAEAKDVTALLGDADFIKYQNQFAAFKGMTIESISFKGGEPGDDIYFTASVNGKTYNFTIEAYLTGPDTDVYNAAVAMKVGDVVDMEGYLYYYEVMDPHIVSIKPAA